MSTLDFSASMGTGGTEQPFNVPPTESSQPTAGSRPLHRIATVRRLQGLSRRAVARRMNCDINTVKEQEQESADLPLSTLYRWQQMLEVPITELLVDAADPLSIPVMKRARMVRLMKTAMAIKERSNQVAIRRMAETLISQFLELMPELKGVSAWHAVGQRRRLDEYGRAADRRLSPDVFYDSGD